MIKNNKGISSVIAVALLMLVAVVSVTTFHLWYNGFASGVYTNVETQSSIDNMNTRVEQVFYEELFFKNGYSNLTINSVKIDGVNCNISGNYLLGLQEIDISNCSSNLGDSTHEIVVYTNKGVYSKKYILDSIPVYSSCTLDLITIDHAQSYVFYNSSLVSFGSSCSSESRICTNGVYSGNISFNLSTCSVIGQDVNPNSFNFTNQSNINLSTSVISNTVVPTGYDGPLAVGITGNGTPTLSVNGGSFVTSTNMSPGDNITIRLTSSATMLTTSVANLTLGNYSTVWSVTTGVDCSALSGSWVKVYGSSTFGTSDFCVMKYEAKFVNYTGKSNSGYGGYSWASATGNMNITSTSAGGPITFLTQAEARSACLSLGTKYHLINNAEWMTIARDAENLTSNWANGVKGSLVSSSGGLYRGNVGQTDSASCGSSTAIYDGDTVGTNCISGSRNKRTIIISTNNLIWDFSGNVNEWNNDTCSSLSWYSGWVEWSNSNLDDYERNTGGPSSSSYDSNYGVGYFYGCTNGYGFIRGGDYSQTTAAGIFRLDLYLATTYTSSGTGFRCAYTP